MCKASLHAAKTRKVKAGETLGIGLISGTLGAFSEQGKAAFECVVCVENGASLTLSGIPQKARDTYALGDTEKATFVETEGSNTHFVHDLLLFPNHPDLPAIPVAHFAGPSVRAKMHTAEGTPDVVEELKRMALKPQLVADTLTLDQVAAQRQRLLDHVS